MVGHLLTSGESCGLTVRTRLTCQVNGNRSRSQFLFDIKPSNVYFIYTSNGMLKEKGVQFTGETENDRLND